MNRFVLGHITVVFTRATRSVKTGKHMHRTEVFYPMSWFLSARLWVTTETVAPIEQGTNHHHGHISHVYYLQKIIAEYPETISGILCSLLLHTFHSNK